MQPFFLPLGPSGDFLADPVHAAFSGCLRTAVEDEDQAGLAY